MQDGSEDRPLTRDEAQALLAGLLEQEFDQQLDTLERVMRVSDEKIRRRAVGLGAALLSDDRIVAFLRDDADDVRRNAGVAMLKLRRKRALELAGMLVSDADPDVALQAVIVLGHLKDLRALEPLRKALAHEDSNVVQEAVVALGHLGHPRALADLLPLLEEGNWVAPAAVEAVGKLGDSSAVPKLAALLPDPLLGAFAGEALTRLGGVHAFDAMARHWLVAHESLDTGLTLRRMARLLQDLACPPPKIPGLPEALEARTQSEDKHVRLSAVSCLVALHGRNRPLAFS